MMFRIWPQMMKCMMKNHLKSLRMRALCPLKLKCPTIVLVESNRSNMSADDQIIESLKSQIQKTEVAKQAAQYQAAKDEVLRLDLETHGRQRVKDGKWRGANCQEVLHSDPEYVMWLIQHHPKNPKFANILEYVRRQETQEMLRNNTTPRQTVIPPANRRASQAMPSTQAALQSFNDEQAPSEIGSDWSAVQPHPMQDAPIPETELSEVTHLLRGMMTGFQELKNRVDQVQATTEGQHAALHQSFGLLQQMQEQQSHQAERLEKIEQDKPPKSAE